MSETVETREDAAATETDAGVAPVAKAASGRRVLKAVILCAVLVVALAVVRLSPLADWLQHIQETSERIRAMGLLAPVIFAAATAVLVALGAPRLVFCGIAGMAFGFSRGLLWAQAGTLVGSYATFVFVRWMGRDFVMRHRPKLGRFAALDPKTATAVALMRQLPLAAVFVNLVLGLSSVRHSRFLLGTIIGTLPESIAAVLVGKAIADKSTVQGVAYIGAAGMFLIILWAVLAFVARRRAGRLNRRDAKDAKGEQLPVTSDQLPVTSNQLPVTSKQ